MFYPSQKFLSDNTFLQIICVSLMAVVTARPQVTDYSDITDENDPRFMFDVSMK